MGLRLLALACLVGAAFAGPVQRQTECATRCQTSENDKFNYEPGKKYVYDFEGINEVVVAGERKQKAEISGQAELNVITKCEMILQLRNIRIEQKASQEEIEELRQKLEIPLPFAFQDGQIDHICSSDEDSSHSLNIKKGILSSLINSMERFDESQEVSEEDSLGTCLTKYTVHNLRQTVIEKEKDLKSCTNRHSSITSLITNPYESPESAIHSAPIFPTDKLTCRQTIENGIMKISKCKEIASIKPLGERIQVIEFEGHMQLALARVESVDHLRIKSMKSPEALTYNLQEEHSVEDLEHEVDRLLREKCSKTTLIDLSASKDFIFLVNSVKRLSYESLQRLYSSLESGRLCSSKKVADMFLDTLPMAGSDGAIRLMVNLLIQQRVTGLKAKLWSASLALVQHPSHESIKSVADLVKEQKTKSVLLGVSSMVYRHCVYSKCVTSQSVKDIVTSLNQVLGQQCSYDSEDEAVAVLKAFGNMGQLLHAEKNILACAKDDDKPIRVRLAAIDAFRRVDKKRPEELLQLYLDTHQDYEVRIAALSSVLRHADERQIAAIKTVAEHESHEQVSAYAGTLISNMNRTSSPLKQDVRRRLNDIEIETPQVGYWENSKNIELSTFSETLNVGGGVETDIIHSPESKVPRSVYTRFDLDVFDNHMNVFEIGLRAEGLEAAFRKLIGFYETKVQKSSWNILKSSNDVDDEKLEAQFFFRTMNTEIADFSISDLNSMGEIIQVADVLNKLSHERTADFSHSFMFVNSKLVIPSVTGRSYSFGLTGSATVGLTAKSKVDIVNILSRSKNCDVHGHFQPSINVELAATAGIHSNRPKPDVKIVTRVHSESHIEAQFKIKDSHLGLVKVSVPSENIAYTKISTDVFEVDAQHEEKPVFENMEKKIDVCFDKLEKPLGISICGKWEVPRPFISSSFPYVKGIGNIEMAIKKTDVGMRGLELSVQIPKRKSSAMTYKASLDTPGSKINRRFSADLEVHSPSRDQKQFSLEVTSPFQSIRASASGSLTTRQDLVDGSVDIQAGSYKRYSVRATCPISETSDEKSYKPSIQISYSTSQPLKVDGTLSISKGRKQQIAFEVKANKPTRKPLELKGTIMKEGGLSASWGAEWKLSSDVALKSPIVNLNVRSSTEKQSKQSHKISSTVTVDYQMRSSQRESLKLSANLQKSSSKVSSVAEFETTAYPSANFLLTWNMQGKLRESLKNDITLKYGKDQEHQFVNILQSSKLPESQPGEFKLAVKAPQFDIDNDVTISHDFEMNSRLHADVDLRYKENKHVKAKFHVDKLSEKPLKLKMKAEVHTPSRRMLYQDELEEISRNSYRGNAAFEWGTDKRTELQYKYQKLSDRSKLHHEIETTLRLPSSQSPIKNKASIEISSEKVGIEGRLSLDRKSEYSMKAQLNKRGASYVNLKAPKLEGNLKLVNENEKKAADFDLKSTLFRRPRHVIASASLGLGSLKKVETEICLDADRKPEDKFAFSSSFEKQPRNKFESKAKFQISDKVNCEISTSGERSIYGRHEASVETKLFKFKPMGFTLRHELRPTKANVMLRLSRNKMPKAEFTLDAEHLRKNRETEVSTTASLKSLDNSFETKKWSYKGLYSRSSESSMTLKSNIKLEWSPSKVYESETIFDVQPNIILTKAYLLTPHQHFERQSLSFSYRQSGDLYASSASVEFANGKSISITSETQKIRGDGLTSSLVLSSPFAMLRDAKVMFSCENKPSQKSIKSHVDVNGSRKAAVEFSFTSAKKTEIKAHMKTTFSPELSAHISCENSPSSFNYDIKVMKNASPLMSASLSKQSSHQDVSYALQSSSQEKTLVNLRMVKEVSPSSTKHKFEAQGPFPEITFNVESSKKDKNSLSVSLEACQKKNVKSCYSVKGYHKALDNEENYRFYRKLTVDIESSSENSSPKSLASINVISSLAGNDLREKFMVELKERKVGYEVRLHRRENEQDQCTLDSHIFTLSSTIRVRGSILHNRKSIVSDFEIVPDASVPSRKLGYELKKEKEGDQITGYIRLHHPEINHPVQLSGHVRQYGIVPVAGKLRLNYAERRQDYIIEIIPDVEGRRQQEKKAITYKVYREDKSFEASAKLMKYSTIRESVYSYDWTCKTKQAQKQGKVSLKLSEKSNGKPRLIEFEIHTPKTTTQLNTRLIWESRIPSGFHLNLLSDAKNIYEMHVKAEQGCVYVDQQLQSRPYTKQEFCFLKQDSKKMTLMSVQSQYKRYKTADVKIEIDPEEPNFANIDIMWDARRQFQAMSELKAICNELVPKYFTEEDVKKIQEKVYLWNQFTEEIFWDTMKKLRDLYSEQVGAMKSYLETVKHYLSLVWDNLSDFLPLDYIKEEVWQPFSASVSCWYAEYTDHLSKYFDEHLRALWEKLIRRTIDTIKMYCPQDSILFEFADALEHMEVERMKVLISSRVSDMKQSVSQCLSSVKLPDFTGFVRRFAETIKREMHRILNALSEGQLPQLFSQYFRRLEEFIVEKTREKYEAIVDWISRIFSHLERDEDFRVVKSFFLECKEQLLVMLKKAEHVAESMWQPMCEYLKEYTSMWFKDFMVVHKFSPKEGKIQVQIRHPFESKHYQVLRSIVTSMKNKIHSA